MMNFLIFNAKKNLYFSNSYTGKFIKLKFEKNEKSFFSRIYSVIGTLAA